jgi:acyl-CoA thioesterase FadM
MKSEKDYRELPNSTDHYCFGCSPVNPAGLRMKFFANEIMSWAALHFLKRITMTKSMNIEFIKPVYIRNPLRAEGRVQTVNGKHDAVMEGILYNDNGDACAKSTANFAIFSPKVAKRFGIADETSLKFFENVFGIK